MPAGPVHPSGQPDSCAAAVTSCSWPLFPGVGWPHAGPRAGRALPSCAVCVAFKRPGDGHRMASVSPCRCPGALSPGLRLWGRVAGWRLKGVRLRRRPGQGLPAAGPGASLGRGLFTALCWSRVHSGARFLVGLGSPLGFQELLAAQQAQAFTGGHLRCQVGGSRLPVFTHTTRNKPLLLQVPLLCPSVSLAPPFWEAPRQDPSVGSGGGLGSG